MRKYMYVYGGGGCKIKKDLLEVVKNDMKGLG